MTNRKIDRRDLLQLLALGSLIAPAAALTGCAAEGQHPRHMDYYGGGGPNQDSRGDRNNGGGGSGGGGGGRGH